MSVSIRLVGLRRAVRASPLLNEVRVSAWTDQDPRSLNRGGQGSDARYYRVK